MTTRSRNRPGESPLSAFTLTDVRWPIQTENLQFLFFFGLEVDAAEKLMARYVVDVLWRQSARLLDHLSMAALRPSFVSSFGSRAPTG